MSAMRGRRVLPRWWTVPAVVIVLGFNIFLQEKWPRLSGPVHFLILIAASVISFGFMFGIGRLITRLRAPWDDP